MYEFINITHKNLFSCLQYTRIPKAYLATTFPKDQQYEDFWKLVWEEDVKYIVLLDNDQATNEVRCSNFT
mgnify:CR=1 FL=1